MKIMTSWLSVLTILSTLSPNLSEASFPLDDLFIRLNRTRHADFGNHGVICEEVAKVELGFDYPSPEYEIFQNVEYVYQKQILGELDVVIRRKKQSEVVLVGEVKCRNNLEQALSSARQQRERFLSYLRSDIPIDFNLKVNARAKIFKDDFDTPYLDFISISQKGGKEVGFDKSLEYTLDELMDLRVRLLRAKKPSHNRH